MKIKYNSYYMIRILSHQNFSLVKHWLGSKRVKLGMDYPLDGVKVPTEEQVKRAEEILHTADYQN